MEPTETGPSPYHYDVVRPLPDDDAAPSPRLIRVHDLQTDPVPENAAQYVKTKVFEIERSNGEVGYQVLNEHADGVSVLPLEVVNDHLYAIMVDQHRYPHVRMQDRHTLDLESAARAGRIGRWSREIISGSLKPGETHEEAIIREANEEAGIIDLRHDQLKPIYPELWTGVGTRRQPFDMRVAQLEDGQWQPEKAIPDLEEGELTVGAYRIDRIMEMIDNNTIWEMSAVTAIGGLWRLPEYRQYF